MINRFPLEVVLMLRKNSEAAQALKLKAAQERRAALLCQLEGTRDELDRLGRARPSAAAAYELLSGQKYGELLYRRCDRLEAEFRKASALEAAQRRELLAALKERKKMETLKEIWAGKRARALARAEAVEMDETARVQFAREAR